MTYKEIKINERISIKPIMRSDKKEILDLISYEDFFTIMIKRNVSKDFPCYYKVLDNNVFIGIVSLNAQGYIKFFDKDNCSDIVKEIFVYLLSSKEGNICNNNYIPLDESRKEMFQNFNIEEYENDFVRR